MANSNAGHLTKNLPGSMKESWAMIYPMIISSLSVSLMIFADRVILAQYSTKAMTAAASAGLIVVTFEFGFMAITGIAETFVGQHNGSGNRLKTSEPVWQMIWFALMTSLFFIPVGYFCSDFFIADPYDNIGRPYFQLLMYFAPIALITSPLSCFFVGIGRPTIVSIVSIIGNVINVVLDWYLVMGIDGILDPMGTKGAAIATNIAISTQAIIYFSLFLGPKFKEKYNTWNIKLNLKPLLDCIKIGGPSAVSHMFELSAWAFQMHLMAMVSEIHITVLAIGQSIFLLFMFIAEGMNRGLGAIAANYMGANKLDIIPKSFRSTIKIYLIIIAIVGTFLLTFNEFLVDLLIEGDFQADTIESIKIYGRLSLIGVWVYLLFDGIVWMMIGILTAAGDTKFIMYINGFGAWIIGILPMYFLIVVPKGSPMMAWPLVSLYSITLCLIFFLRYKSGSWRINRVKNLQDKA